MNAPSTAVYFTLAAVRAARPPCKYGIASDLPTPTMQNYIFHGVVAEGSFICYDDPANNSDEFIYDAHSVAWVGEGRGRGSRLTHAMVTTTRAAHFRSACW